MEINKLISPYYNNAETGSLYYNKDTNCVMAKINNKWEELSYHAVGDIVMSTLSTDDFNSKHYGTWTVLKSETVGNKTVNYFLKTA